MPPIIKTNAVVVKAKIRVLGPWKSRFRWHSLEGNLSNTVVFSGIFSAIVGTRHQLTYPAPFFDSGWPSDVALLKRMGAFNLSWVLPSSNLNREPRKNRDEEKQGQGVPPYAHPFQASGILGFLLHFSGE
ncbi:hypothetical protein [Sulfidibacter corallicola]|uniref:Uncharacterized protein n=1 Tax=Sulfidibacter corallicola TaxID=2818388 RepID=A0A8A4TLF7_SULCO|nr:hypothetical protein [Sulfidibacter corallicola]QTD49698.1 hypothetical protein J3U87_29290 [Sulfidibacter corallicola]